MAWQHLDKVLKVKVKIHARVSQPAILGHPLKKTQFISAEILVPKIRTANPGFQMLRGNKYIEKTFQEATFKGCSILGGYCYLLRMSL